MIIGNEVLVHVVHIEVRNAVTLYICSIPRRTHTHSVHICLGSDRSSRCSSGGPPGSGHCRVSHHLVPAEV